MCAAPRIPPSTTPWACSLDLGSPRGDPRIHQNSNLSQGPCQTTKMTPKASQRVPKGYPLDTIFGCFGAPGGNVKTMVSFTRNHRFHGWRRSPETPEASKEMIQKRLQKKYRKSTKHTENCSPKGAQGEAKRRSTNQHFRHFFDLAPLGVPWGAPGSPKDLNGPQNTSKMTPKSLPRVLK